MLAGWNDSVAIVGGGLIGLAVTGVGWGMTGCWGAVACSIICGVGETTGWGWLIMLLPNDTGAADENGAVGWGIGVGVCIGGTPVITCCGAAAN
jgi:hypothetical protein